MKQQNLSRVLWSIVFGCLSLSLVLVTATWAQQTQGTVSVTVMDPSGSVIPSAQLKLVDLATNDAREATTQESGNYTFVNLNAGSYKLTVSKESFETQSYDVVVQAVRTTDVRANLKVGPTQQVVEVVGGVAPLIETSSSATATTIDTKQIEDLPLGGRDISQLSRLAAGYNGTWNGLPSTAQGNTFDGVVGNTGRWRYQSTDSAARTGVTPRLENIAEMTVSTDQIDMNQGWGTSAMQITYVTRRGTNAFHGRLFEDHRNAALNAYNWRSAVKPKFILNEFGGSLGGPILKDKLFFFGSFSMSKQPGSRRAENRVFMPEAQSGIFTFGDGQKVNLYNVVSAYNTAHPGAGLPTVLNADTASRLAEINGYVPNGTLLATPETDPNIWRVYWYQSNPITYYYPTIRVDYNISQNLRLNLAYNQTKMNSPGANSGWWPGDGREADNKSNALTAAFGLEWTISPTLINQFKAGYLYTANWFGIGGSSGFLDNPQVFWNYNTVWPDPEMSGLVYNLPNSRMQPVISLSDTVTWVKGPHTFSFGFNAYRDQNKYWDPPEGYPNITLAPLATGDPALQALTAESLTVNGVTPNQTELSSARQLYAILTGRVSDFTGRHAYEEDTGEYSTGVRGARLNELMKSWGLFFQDSYKAKRNFTLNFGLRWDFVGPDKDLTGKYHTMTPTDLFGPSGVWNLFNPGVLRGAMDPLLTVQESAYGSWHMTPQPAIGIAWTPRSDGNFLEKLLGGDKTVVRAGYSLRRFTEPQQFVWDMGSAYAAGFYQPFYARANFSGDLGTFAPGSVSLGDAYPQFKYTPETYQKVMHLADATFGDVYVAGMDPKIRQPYTQSWNIGIQRELGASRVFEVRYNGNRTIRQWIAQNINEVNIFENGFLNEFKNAQANLAINRANNVESFAYLGLPGQTALPIMTAAGVNFTDAPFIQNLDYGQAGSFASTLTGPDYFCNMVGSTFSPCAWAGAGKGYPINFFMANPFSTGAWMGTPFMSDRGFSNYHGLQFELRQRAWHGLTMTANYTWSRTLGVATSGDWMGGYRQVTVRDINSSYAPATTDRNHLIHINATYDLPIGKGKQWLNQGGIVDKILGGWTVSTVLTWQSGSPFRLIGDNYTFNDQADGGVVLNGITAKDIEDHVGLFYTNTGQVRYLDPIWINNILSTGKLTSNTTPGTWGDIIWLHGPTQTYTDIGISKAISFTERIKFKFQTEMLNAFNHPVFAQSNTYVGDTSGFGAGTQTGTSRRIELRANLEF